MNEDEIKLARQAVWKLIITSLGKTLENHSETVEDVADVLTKSLQYVASCLNKNGLEDFWAAHECLVAMAEINQAARGMFNKT